MVLMDSWLYCLKHQVLAGVAKELCGGDLSSCTNASNYGRECHEINHFPRACVHVVWSRKVTAEQYKEMLEESKRALGRIREKT